MHILKGAMSNKGRKTDKSGRLECWLLQLSEHLDISGIETRLAYDDRRGGNWLVLRILLREQGYAELIVRRQLLTATLYLAVDRSQAAALLALALRGFHRKIQRRRNARRKFIHRVEQMAEALAQTFDARAADYPAERLQQLARLVPSARPMTGLKAPFRQKLAAEGDDRFPTVYAARVETQNGPRLIPYDRRAERFNFRGVTTAVLTAAAAIVGAVALSEYAVASDQGDGDQRDGDQRGEWLDNFADGALDVTADVAEEGAEAALEIGAEAVAEKAGFLSDLDCIDLPDCDVCDVPDCAF